MPFKNIKNDFRLSQDTFFNQCYFDLYTLRDILDLDKLQRYHSFNSTLCVHTLFTHYLAFDHQESTPCDYYELFIPVKALRY